MAKNIHKLVRHFRSLHQQEKRHVLATIIETMGSTYQKAGARMLIIEQGEFKGLLGGGCFESDLREQAESVFADGKTKTVFYDMRSPDDAIWGLGLGCNGAVRVFLQLLSTKDQYHPLDVIELAVDNNKTGILVTVQESDHKTFPPGKSVFLEATNDNGQLSIINEDHEFYIPARQTLLQNKPQIVKLVIDEKPLQVFCDIIKPPSRLLLAGAGPDAVPVAWFARTLGWQITIVDHRPAYIRAERFPDADQLLNVTPENLKEKIRLDQFDAMVLMTHSIDYDERYLKVIADSTIPYIGLLGPAKRRDRLLQSLDGAAEKISGRVYGPTGLDIGAETPEEIALSILAEIQAVSVNRDGGQLYRKDLPLHDRGTPN